MPILVLVIAGVIAFDVLFVVARVRATRPHAPRADAHPSFAYATIESPRHHPVHQRRR